MQHPDAIVIGGSYAGLSAALQLARTGRRVSVIDSGEPRNRFAAASHGFFGLDGMSPQQMIAEAQQKLEAYTTAELVRDVAVEASKMQAAHNAHQTGCALPREFAVQLASGATRTASKLVLAFGVTDTLPDLPGVAERWGRTVLHCPYCHGYEFLGRRLGVLSVSPMSIHQALLVADWGPVTLFLHGGKGPEESDRGKLARRGVQIEPVPVIHLEGDAPGLTGLRLADGRLAPLDALYLGTRTNLASPLAEQLGCACDEGPFGLVIRTDASKMTTVPGVYAAGDIARVPHNAMWAAADGTTAGISLHQALVFEPLATA